MHDKTTQVHHYVTVDNLRQHRFSKVISN